MRAVAFLKVVGASDVSSSFVIAGSHCGFIDTGCLAVSLYGAAARHSTVTFGDSWRGCSILAEKLPVVRLYDGLHISGTTV